jgi:lipopolysaccharide export system protein LptA
MNNRRIIDHRALPALPILCAALLLGGVLSAPAQPKGRKVAVKRQDPKTGTPFRFGDVTLSGYQTMTGQFGVSAEARGPNTTVDVADPKSPASKSQLKANLLQAYMAPNTGGREVDRVEATGNVRFTSARPRPDGTLQTLTGTATKATYFKRENRIVLDGPVNYDGQLNDKAGKMIQSATGDANKAEYNEVSQDLVLTGDVDVNVRLQDMKEPASLSNLSSLKLELGKQPIAYHLNSGTVNFKPKQQ